MKKLIKIFLCTIIFCVFGIGALSVYAQTFQDVNKDAWYYDFVENLTVEGFFDDAQVFRPDDSLTRGELAYYVIKSINGLADFEPPENPTFSDVPVDSEYYEYIEAAVFLGILGGYTDNQGRKTGVFGYDDPVTRAATTKILVNTFDFPLNVTTESVFPDVVSGDWYHDYVVTAYNNLIINGYENGNFGPADPVTRAQISKLIFNSRDVSMHFAAQKEAEPEPEPEPHLLVELVNPVPGRVVSAKITSVKIISLKFTAIGSNVELKDVNLTRTGLGNNADWALVLPLMNGFRAGSDRALSSGVANVTFNTVIPEGQSVVFDFYGVTALTSVAGAIHRFNLNSSDDVVTATVPVEGDFPMYGDQIQIGTQYCNTVTMTPSTTPVEPKRDQISEVANFNLQAGASSDLFLGLVFFRQGGTLEEEKIRDCSLYRGNELVGASPGFMGDKLIFSMMQSPYLLPKNQNKKFTIKCYIDGGKSSDTIQLYVEEPYDALATDTQFGCAAAFLNGFTQSTAPSVNLRGAEIIFK